MTIIKTKTGFEFQNLNILGPNDAYHLVSLYDWKELIPEMAKSFQSTEFLVDFGMFWYLVNTTDLDISVIEKHLHPKYMQIIKSKNYEVKHCTEVFKNIPPLKRIHYDYEKYYNLIRRYKWYYQYKFNR